MNVLAIDPGARCGSSLWRVDDPPELLTWDSWEWSGRTLVDYVLIPHAHVLVVETQYAGPNMRTLIGLVEKRVAIEAAWQTQRAGGIYRVAPATWQAHVARGCGGSTKARVMRAAEKIVNSGLDSQDAADAIMLGHYAARALAMDVEPGAPAERYLFPAPARPPASPAVSTRPGSERSLDSSTRKHAAAVHARRRGR